MGAEGAEEEVTAGPEHPPQGGQVARPIGLSLMVQAAIIEDHIEGGDAEGQVEDIGHQEADRRLESGFMRPGFGATKGSRFVIDADGIKALPCGGQAVPTLSATEIEQPS